MKKKENSHRKSRLTQKVNMRLTQTIDLLSKGKSQSDIAKDLKISKVAVHKYIKRLIANNIISESPESKSNLKFYHVNQILTMCEKRLTRSRYTMIFDPHNYALKFKIVPNGSGVPFETKVKKRNWDAEYLQYETVIFEKTTKHLIGYLGDRIKFNIKDSSDIKNIEAMIHSIIIQQAQKVVKDYKMMVDLNHPMPCRRELKVVDPEIKPNDHIFHSEKVKKAYKDNSLEFKDETSLKNYVDNRVMENKADVIINELSCLKEILGGISKSNTQMFNLQALSTQILNELKNAVLKGFEGVRGENIQETAGESLKTPLECTENDDLMHIKALITIPAFMGDMKGELHKYPQINKGCDIWIERKTAKMLIRQEMAEEISS